LYVALAWIAAGTVVLGLAQAKAAEANPSATATELDTMLRPIAAVWAGLVFVALAIGWRLSVIRMALVQLGARDVVVAMAQAMEARNAGAGGLKRHGSQRRQSQVKFTMAPPDTQDTAESTADAADNREAAVHQAHGDRGETGAASLPEPDSKQIANGLIGADEVGTARSPRLLAMSSGLPQIAGTASMDTKTSSPPPATSARAPGISRPAISNRQPQAPKPARASVSSVAAMPGGRLSTSDPPAAPSAQASLRAAGVVGKLKHKKSKKRRSQMTIGGGIATRGSLVQKPTSSHTDVLSQCQDLVLGNPGLADIPLLPVPIELRVLRWIVSGFSCLFSTKVHPQQSQDRSEGMRSGALVMDAFGESNRSGASDTERQTMHSSGTWVSIRRWTSSEVMTAAPAAAKRPASSQPNALDAADKALRAVVDDSVEARRAVAQLMTSSTQVELAARAMIGYPGLDSSERLAASSLLFEIGLRCFETADVRVHFARYVEHAHEDVTRALALYRQAASCSPGVVERFAVFQRVKAAEQSRQTTSLGRSGQGLDSAGYIEYRKLERSAAVSHSKAVVLLRQIWTRIAAWERQRVQVHTEESVKPLAKRLRRLHTASDRATKAYLRLVNKYPRATTLLRQFGAFLLDVRCRPDGADVLFGRADEVEDEDSRVEAGAADASSEPGRTVSKSIHSGSGSSSFHFGASAMGSEQGGSKSSGTMLSGDAASASLLERSTFKIKDEDFKAVAGLSRGVAAGVVVMAFLMVTAFITTVVMLSEFQASIQATYTSALRRETAEELLYDIRSIQIAAVSANNSLWQQYRSKTLADSVKVASAHEELRPREAGGTVSQFMRSFPLQVSESRTSISAVAAPRYRQSNPSDALQDFVVAARRILSIDDPRQLEAAVLNTDNSDWWYVTHNSHQTIIPALGKVTRLYEAGDAYLAELFHWIQIAILSLMLTMNLFVFFGIFWPAGRRVASEAVSLIEVVPVVQSLGVARRLQSAYARAERRLRGEDLDFEDDDGDEDNDVGGTSSGAGAAGGPGRQDGGDAVHGQDNPEARATSHSSQLLPSSEHLAEDQDSGASSSSQDGKLGAQAADLLDELLTPSVMSSRRGGGGGGGGDAGLHEPGPARTGTGDVDSTGCVSDGASSVKNAGSGAGLDELFETQNPRELNDLEQSLSAAQSRNISPQRTKRRSVQIDPASRPQYVLSGAAAGDQALPQALKPSPAPKAAASFSSASLKPGVVVEARDGDDKDGAVLPINPNQRLLRSISRSMMLILLLIAGLQVIIFYTAYEATELAKEEAIEIVAAAERADAAVSAAIMIRELFVGPGAFGEPAELLVKAATKAAAARELHTSLRFGNPALHLQASDQRFPLQTQLLYGAQTTTSMTFSQALEPYNLTAGGPGGMEAYLAGANAEQAKQIEQEGLSTVLSKYLSDVERAIDGVADALGVNMTVPSGLAHLLEAADVSAVLATLQQVAQGTGSPTSRRSRLLSASASTGAAASSSVVSGEVNSTAYGQWARGSRLAALLGDEQLAPILVAMEGPFPAALRHSVSLYRAESTATVQDEIIREGAILGANLVILALLYWMGLRVALASLLTEARLSHDFLDVIPQEALENLRGEHAILSFFQSLDDDDGAVALDRKASRVSML
jgi:hypothetical protein